MNALQVKNLSVRFQMPNSTVLAVDNISFDVKPGETLAIVGESGSGKSQTMLAVMGILAKNGTAAGTVHFGDQDLLQMSQGELNRVRGSEISMIFQDPMTSLNPYIRIGDQMAEVLTVHKGMARSEALKECERMLDAVKLSNAKQVLRRFPHQLSGGMRQRVMIATALLCRPKILIADEPTTALDVTVQAQMLDLFKGLTDDFGTALVMITHDLGVVAGLADRMMVMYAGRIVEAGTVDQLFYHPQHPYTFGLLRSTPHVETADMLLQPIEGLPPSLEHLPAGCAFQPRCAFAMSKCQSERPSLNAGDDGRLRACFHEGVLSHKEVQTA